MRFFQGVALHVDTDFLRQMYITKWANPDSRLQKGTLALTSTDNEVKVGTVCCCEEVFLFEMRHKIVAV
jgi:hypothetical protein